MDLKTETVHAPEAAAQADALAMLLQASRRALAEATDISSGAYDDRDMGTSHWGCCHKEMNTWPRADLTHARDCWTHALREALANFDGVA